MSDFLRPLEANQRQNPLLQLQKLQSRLREIERLAISRNEAEARFADKNYVNRQDARQLVAQMLKLPQLRGLWPMSSVDESGNAIDLSAQGRDLTNNNGVTYGTSGSIVYADFDGVNQSLSRADEAGLDITGELTAGLWLYLDSWTAGDAIMGKDSTSSQRSWRLSLTGTYGSSHALRVELSANGSAVAVTLDTAQNKLATGRWHHVIVRYDPSTELAIFANSARYATTSGIPASLHNSSAALGIGFTTGATGYLDGRVKLGFMCAAVLDNDEIGRLFDRQRALFDV